MRDRAVAGAGGTDGSGEGAAGAVPGVGGGGVGAGGGPGVGGLHGVCDTGAIAGGRGVPVAGVAAVAGLVPGVAGGGAAAGGDGAGGDAKDQAGVQQLAAVQRDGGDVFAGGGRGVGRDAGGLRAAAARAVVQGRRDLRRRSGFSLGLLQFVRHSAVSGNDLRAGGRADAGAGGEDCAAICGGAGTDDRDGRDVPGGGPVDVLPDRGVSSSGQSGAAGEVAGRGGGGARGVDGGAGADAGDGVAEL